jgi:TolA-binding protein
MNQAVANLDESGLDVPIEDVWSRTDARYRRRATILLIVNVLLFAGLGCVAYWLRTGVVFAPTSDHYFAQLAATFNPAIENEYTPTGLSLGPIRVDQVPMMIVVLGLVLAALVSIPILATILYRLPCALPFIAVVGLVAVMPWLAITLLASCLTVSLNPLRFRSRFATVLLALIPEIFYFFLASRQSAGVVDLLPPEDRIKMVAPLILALIVSAVVMGLVLIIARLVNYRPGAIAPLLAVLFLTPAAIFEFQVGRDELHYRILEQQYGPGSEYFVQEKIGSIFEAAVERAFAEKRGGDAPYDAVRSAVELKWLLALDADANLHFTKYQDQAARAAERFVRLFPDSDYAISALYIEGRALDMRVDLEEFRRQRKFRFYDQFPSSRSRLAWEKIEFNAPNSSAASEAMLRLAILDTRDGDVASAIRRLKRLEDTFGQDRPVLSDEGDATADTKGPLARPRTPEVDMHIPVAQAALDGRKLRLMIEQNRDPLWNDEPLTRLMRLDPRDANYALNLDSLLEQFPNCRLADNVSMLRARAEADAKRRIEMLQRCVESYPNGDAVPSVLYELGSAHQELRHHDDARSMFKRLIAEYPEQPWRTSAEERLRQLDRAAGENA